MKPESTFKPDGIFRTPCAVSVSIYNLNLQVVIENKQHCFHARQGYCRFKMDANDFIVAERNLRIWICQTIVRPLARKIDEVNDMLAKVRRNAIKHEFGVLIQKMTVDQINFYV